MGLLAALYLSSQKQNVQKRAAAGEVDTLDYFVSDHALRINPTGPKATEVTQYVSGNFSFYAKTNAAYEYHTWDGINIYLNQDTSVGNFSVNGATATSYRMSGGVWMKRFMKLGERIEVHPTVTWYDNNCHEVAKWTTWYYFVTLEKEIPNFQVGGDLGNQDVIVLKYDYLSGYEKFYYSREWGWVRWEEYDAQTDQMKRSVDFNRFSSGFLDVKGKCGTPTPNIPKPTPPPPPPNCQMGNWQNGTCAGSCPAGQRQQTRTVSPAGCATTTQCVSDSSCNTVPPTNQTHKVCVNNSCKVVSGAGTDQCLVTGAQCGGTGGDVLICPSAYDARCYDCNRDGEVNILDFSCFKNVYGQKT